MLKNQLSSLVFFSSLLLSSCNNLFPESSSQNDASSSSLSEIESSLSSEVESSSSTILVSSSSASSSSTPDIRIYKTINRDNWTSLSTYPDSESTVTIEDSIYGFYAAGNYTAGVIQGKRNEFYFYNKTPMNSLISVSLSLSQSHTSHSIFVGNTEKPTTNPITPLATNGNTSFLYSVEAIGDYRYFNFVNGDAAIYINSISLVYGTLRDISSSNSSSEPSSSSESSSSSSSPSSTASSLTSSTSPSVSVPTNAPTYYNSISPSLTGESLKNALDVLISSNVSVNYDWSRFLIVDQSLTNTNAVLTIYPKANYPKGNQVGGTQPAGYWNREHTYPQSKISGAATSDTHHIFADDHKTNSQRGNKPFGDIANTEANRVYDSLDRPTLNYQTSTYFEPNDEAKGEVARATLYLNTLYGYAIENNFQSKELAVLWAIQYPVTDWSMTRNNRIYTTQGNRNPYIDYPQWICDVYGQTSTATMEACA